MKTSKTFSLMVLALFVLSTFAFGQQQWNGAQDAAGDIFRTGKVGIGTSIPGLRLHVNGEVDDFVRLSSVGQPQVWDIGIGKTIAPGTFFIARSGISRDFSIAANGNVGIGTPDPNMAKLTVSTQKTNDGIWLDGGNNKGVALLTNMGQGSWNPLSQAGDHMLLWKGAKIDEPGAGLVIAPWRNDASGIRIDAGGNVGIGIDNPGDKLHVSGGGIKIGSSGSINENWWEFGLDDGKSGTCIDFHGGSALKDFTARIYRLAGDNSEFQVANNGTGSMHFFTNNSPRMTITGDGKIGIGTTNPQSKFDVNGTMRAKEILVTLENWPDTVFHNDYDLMSLDELEKFIRKNHHLPSIPSETEVVATSVNVGEMQAKLLQKVEELTLYVIALKKENDKLNREVGELRKKLE